MPESELLPCPFCGDNPLWRDGDQKTIYGNEQLYCPTCFATAAPDGSKEKAAGWWNMRAESSELATLCQQLDALLEAAEQVITKVESNIKLAEAGNNNIGLGWRLAQRDIEAFREMKGE